MPRGKRKRGLFRVLIELIKVLRVGGSAILFPEGGRTHNGDRFVYSVSGKRLRELKDGVGRLICRTGCIVVPVWVDDAEKVLPPGCWFPRFWRVMTITIGKPFCQERMENPSKQDFKVTTKRVSDALLKTAG